MPYIDTRKQKRTSGSGFVLAPRKWLTTHDEWRTATPQVRLELMVAHGFKRSDYALDPSGEFGIVYVGSESEEERSDKDWRRRRRLLASAVALPGSGCVDPNALVTTVLEARRLAAKQVVSRAEHLRFIILMEKIADLKSGAATSSVESDEDFLRRTSH